MQEWKVTHYAHMMRISGFDNTWERRESGTEDVVLIVAGSPVSSDTLVHLTKSFNTESVLGY